MTPIVGSTVPPTQGMGSGMVVTSFNRVATKANFRKPISSSLSFLCHFPISPQIGPPRGCGLFPVFSWMRSFPGLFLDAVFSPPFAQG